MGSGGHVELSSSPSGPLRQSDPRQLHQSIQAIIRGQSPSFSTSSSSSYHHHVHQNGVINKLLPVRSIEVITHRIQSYSCGLQGMRTQMLTGLMSCLLIIMLYCTISGGSSTPITQNYNLYYIEHPHRMDPPHNTSQHFPHAIIIGVRKGGTRALIEFLNLHWQIEKADDEMHFFDRPEQYERGLQWYKGQMPFTHSDQLTLEKTPAYFITPEAPSRILNMNPKTKILLIVRDPVIRVLSDYTQILTSRTAQNLPCKSFEDLVIDPLTGGINLGYKAVQISMYHHHYRRWKATFPASQIHIVDGDKLIQNPVVELAKVESFLGIQHALTPSHFYFNKTKGFYCMKRNATSERCLGPSKGRTHPNVDHKITKKLRQFFAPHNDIFYNITGRMFDWPEE